VQKKGSSMLSNQFIRRAIFVVCDIAIVIFSAFMQMGLRFGFFDILTCEYYDAVVKWLPVDCIIAVVILAVFRLYNRVWSFASIDVLRDVFLAALSIEACYLAYHMILGVSIPRSFYIFDWMCLFLCLCASRISVRVIRRFQIERHEGDDTKHVMVVGCGDAGALLINEIKNDSTGKYKVVCAIDDNPAKRGNTINGVKIVGGRELIPEMIRKYDVDDMVISMPSAAPSEIKDVIKLAEGSKAKVKIMPGIAASINGSVSQTVREINYEDLLQREPIKIVNPDLKDSIKGKTIMVTGGGGSIGSELCRQLMANHPGKLVIVDIYENTTYTLERELRELFPDVKLYVRIGSVRDYDRMEALMSEFQPNIIYHAEAHKHVQLMEDSPNEAIKNNCLGTLNMARLADKYQVEKFVMISTDKAVNPTNIMGATKRICEMIIQTWDKKSETEFVAVRFGNVLGSNGSVIPIFLKQIENGGPVTLTHREITRFFMTIPEAVNLVLIAGLMAKGGEIFVLDMGEPVKIYDLACELIRMKGYVPEKEIRIDVVGLRPGEKLYEELLMDEEGLTETTHRLIHIGQPIKLDEDKFEQELKRLISKAEKGTVKYQDVQKICPTFERRTYSR